MLRKWLENGCFSSHVETDGLEPRMWARFLGKILGARIQCSYTKESSSHESLATSDPKCDALPVGHRRSPPHSPGACSPPFVHLQASSCSTASLRAWAASLASLYLDLGPQENWWLDGQFTFSDGTYRICISIISCVPPKSLHFEYVRVIVDFSLHVSILGGRWYHSSGDMR